MSSPADIDIRQGAARSLGDAMIEMIGTLLAAAARMMTRVSGIGHLIAAALMMLVVTIVKRLPDGLRPWPATRFDLRRDALNILHKLHILNAVDMLDMVRSRPAFESDVT